MLASRVIPCLLIKEDSLVKTVKFRNSRYVGDPLNTCRIFNELEVDEMIILDIEATKKEKGINYELLQKLASECFMPLVYGGGITTCEQAKRLFNIGFEKIAINSGAFRSLDLIREISNIYGAQSIIASIDVAKNLVGKYRMFSAGGTRFERGNFIEWIQKLEMAGVGEIMLTNINKEGTWEGFDLDLIKKVSQNTSLPLIVHGGAGSSKDVEDAVNLGGASAVALGSMVVFQKKGMGVLVNYTNKYNFFVKNKIDE